MDTLCVQLVVKDPMKAVPRRACIVLGDKS